MEFGNAHNLAINESSGCAYTIGSDTFDEASHMVKLAQPRNPLFSRCGSQGHIYDTQFVDYSGPNPNHVGAQICLEHDKDHFAIVDLTSKPGTATPAGINYPVIADMLSES